MNNNYIGVHKHCKGMLEVLIEIDTGICTIMCDKCMEEWNHPNDALNDKNGYRNEYYSKVSRIATKEEIYIFGWGDFIL